MVKKAKPVAKATTTKIKSIQHPVFEDIIPSTNKKVTYRPFLVKEEKILLMAQQSENVNDKIAAIKQVVNNCVTTKGFDVDKLMIFDIEYLFLKIRGNSVNNIITVNYKDAEDGKVYTLEVDLNNIQINFNPDHNNKIELDGVTTLVLNYPGMKLPDSVVNAKNENEAFLELVKSCLKQLYQEDSLHDFEDLSEEEKDNFLNEMTLDNFEKIKKFFETMPRLKYDIEYTNSLGHARKITLETLEDFFMFR